MMLVQKLLQKRLKFLLSQITVNRKYFDVKIFSDSMACAKIKRTKYMRNINDNAVQGRLSENYLMQKNYRMKYGNLSIMLHVHTHTCL